MSAHTGAGPRRLLAIALASFAVLFLQIAITRVLSVVLWYHWAFLSVSLAMLGLGAPGVWFALRPPADRLLPRLLFFGGLSIPAVVHGVLSSRALLARWDAAEQAVLLCMVWLLVPFLLLGAAVCQLLLYANGAAIARLYGADLLGASVAAALVLPVLSLLPTPDATALLGLLPILASVVVGGSRALAAIGVLAIVAAVCWGRPFEVTMTKSYDEREHRPVHVRWTPTARLAFFESPKDKPLAHGWGYGTKVPTVYADQYWMEQDAGAGTPLTRWDGDQSDLSEFDHLLFDVTAVGYQLRPPARVAVIGSGGGRDILTALVARATDVDAVELNAGVVDAVSTRFREFAGDIYHARGVHAAISEGRSFLTRSAGGYDLLQIALIDSWAATASGAYALAENNLYTVEACELYLQRLAPHGLVSISRWVRGENCLELSRLLVMNQRVLRRRGIVDPNRHLAVVRGGMAATVLTSVRPFTPAEYERLRAICEQRGLDLLWPVAPQPAQIMDIANLLERGPGTLESFGLVMDPPTDDRPFFFQSFPVFGTFDTEFARGFGTNAMSVRTLQWLMVILLAITALLYFLPFALVRWLPRGPGFWQGSGYFAAIGLAFMLIEVPWLQRFVLFVGHPAIAATVVIGALLLGAGLGALQSERTGLQRWRRLWPVVPIALALLNLGMPLLCTATLGLGMALRIAITVLLLLPIGFLLGHFFPLGMLRFGDTHKAWYWALNGASGVLASACALGLSMAFGFTAVAWIGVGCYVLAGLLLGGGIRSATT